MTTLYLQEVFRETATERRRLSFNRVFLFKLRFLNYIVDTSVVSQASSEQPKRSFCFNLGKSDASSVAYTPIRAHTLFFLGIRIIVQNEAKMQRKAGVFRLA